MKKHSTLKKMFGIMAASLCIGTSFISAIGLSAEVKISRDQTTLTEDQILLVLDLLQTHILPDKEFEAWFASHSPEDQLFIQEVMKREVLVNKMDEVKVKKPKTNKRKLLFAACLALGGYIGAGAALDKIQKTNPEAGYADLLSKEGILMTAVGMIAGSGLDRFLHWAWKLTRNNMFRNFGLFIKSSVGDRLEHVKDYFTEEEA